LTPSLEKAADAATVVAELHNNPRQAAESYGRPVGVSRARIFCLRGVGTIVAINKKDVGISLSGTGNTPDVILQTGLLFGNTVRDASGLLQAGDFSNSQQFNEISTELNRMVETRVIAPLKEHSELGRTIKFIGCAQVVPEPAGVTPLRIIPLRVEIQ
jgi:predicted lipoprotein